MSMQRKIASIQKKPFAFYDYEKAHSNELQIMGFH